MDKTRDSTNSKIWPDSTCAISVRRKGQILLVVESLVLSTTDDIVDFNSTPREKPLAKCPHICCSRRRRLQKNRLYSKQRLFGSCISCKTSTNWESD